MVEIATEVSVGEKKKFGDTSYTVSDYHRGGDRDHDLKRYIERSEKTANEISRFEQMEGKKREIEEIVAPYGNSIVTVEFGIDNNHSLQIARIIEAEVETGQEALVFLGYGLNEEKPALPKEAKVLQLPVQRRLDQIQFHFIGEAVSPEGKRWAEFRTTALLPNSSEFKWREMCQGYIREI